jgi:HD-GYP domain-containing protein (c-di-GMP phosphodiesterase class II)
MLGAISRALEERDQTQGHGVRVAALAEPVAAQLGWDAARLSALRFGAPLHDIGKIAVRLDVLRKSGPLTGDELSEIQRHPSAGASLMLSMRAGYHALPYVLYHHERWDGTGYPSGLAGEAIPVEARVLAVADAFDAMTSPRPYRTALTTDRALEEVHRCTGTQFDPVVAEVFLEIWSERSGVWPAQRAS